MAEPFRAIPPALTVWQPFASELVRGVKIIENRSWQTGQRGWMLIHAGTGNKDTELPTGAIVGAARLIDIHTTPPGLPGEEPGYRCYWQFADPIEFTDPIPVGGRQGLWPIPATLHEAVHAEWAESAAA